jgi:hypothetical protein
MSASINYLFVNRALATDWNPLPNTGQTKCYDVDGNEINCPAAGHPLHGQDAQYFGVAASCTNNGNGTITDNNAGLVWQQVTADTNNDSTINADDRLTWQDAINYCNGLSYGGSSDWRLPERIELNSIVDYGRHSPAINTNYFSCQSDYYWSATALAFDANVGWTIFFYSGWVVNYTGENVNYVRCVRDEQ